MLSLLLLVAAGSVGVPTPPEFDHRRRPPAVEEVSDSARTYWRREGNGWRRVTRERGQPTRHEWAPSVPTAVRGPEVPRAPSGLFRPWVNHETGSWPEAVGLGDLNGDGRRDIALVTSFYFDPVNDYHVFVYLQTAAGGLAPPVKYGLPAAYGGNNSLDVGDVTGDGRDDVVVGSGAAILVLRQNASGTLEPYVPYATDDSVQIKIGDFNHDGRKDVAGIDWGTAGVAVYLQNASGTLDPPTSYPAPHGGWDELEAGDVNNDGLDDIVVMSGQGLGATLNVLLQLPAGGFAPPAPYALPVSELTSGAEVADLNGDARKDVVVTYGGNQPAFIGIFAQNASGSLNSPFTLGSYDIPEPVESADLDANGRADLAVLHGGWTAMGIYLQNTSGTLGLEALEPIPYASHYTPQGITIGDVSGDGRPDAVIADYNYGLVVVYQKTPVDLGVTIDGPTTAVTGSNVTYEVRVRNFGTTTVTGAVLQDAPSGGLQFVGSQPPSACFFASGAVTCPLPALLPGQEMPIDLVFAGVAAGPQVHQVTLTTPSPDGYPGDNTASFTTQFQGSCQERLMDGSFEFGTSPVYWSQSSTNFGTPLCTFGTCGNGGGTAAAHSGAWWAWFGGINGFEQGDVTQSVTLPIGSARLRFWLWIGARSGNGADVLRASIDGTPVFTALESAPGFGAYTLVDVDVSPFANGASHVLRIQGVTFGPGVTNFSVDDVSLEWCPLPVLSIANAANVTEGNGGTTNATFDLSLSQPTTQQATVAWSTGSAAAGTPATAGADYTPSSGVVTFPPGVISQSVSVPVLGDALDEFDETFAVALSAPVGASLGASSGQATILDDDPLPTVSIADATLFEGQSGTTPGQFAVALTPVSGRPVSGTFGTADGTALAGADYTAASGSFTVPAGAASAFVTVPVLGDLIDEQDETFTTTIASPDFAVLGDPQAVATIDDDDGPALAIADASVTEGNAGTTPAAFTLSLSGPSVQAVTLEYATSGGTAVPGGDFTPTSGSVTFAPGETSATVDVPVLGDLQDEPNEFFSVLLTNTVDATLADAQADGLIVDDDGGAFPIGGLIHGSDEWRTLAGPSPRDLFVLARPARSSFEVLVDSASGDLGSGNGPRLRRLAPDLSQVLQDSVPVGTGPARHLTVRNDLPTPQADYVEVASVGCSTDCGPDDAYRIRVRETTLSAPRFNNSGGQLSVVILQNRTDRALAGRLWFWSAAGAELASAPFNLGPRQSLTLNTASIAALAGRGGTITAAHDGPYGGLVGKAVALEPASGFSFDTSFEVRRR